MYCGLGGQAEQHGARAGRDDDALRLVLDAVRPHAERALREVDLLDHRVEDLGAKRAACARKCSMSSGPMMPSGKPG